MPLDILAQAASFVANKDVPPVPVPSRTVTLVADLAGAVALHRKVESDIEQSLCQEVGIETGQGVIYASNKAVEAISRLRAQIDELREQLAGEQASHE